LFTGTLRRDPPPRGTGILPPPPPPRPRKSFFFFSPLERSFFFRSTPGCWPFIYIMHSICWVICLRANGTRELHRHFSPFSPFLLAHTWCQGHGDQPNCCAPRACPSHYSFNGFHAPFCSYADPPPGIDSLFRERVFSRAVCVAPTDLLCRFVYLFLFHAPPRFFGVPDFCSCVTVPQFMF